MCKDPEETEFIMAGKAWQLTPEAGCFIGGQEAERDKSKWGQALGLQRPPPVMYFLQQTYTSSRFQDLQSHTSWDQVFTHMSLLGDI